MHPDDQEKMVFITKWGVLIVIVMMFGLQTTTVKFHRIIMEIFGDYIPAFMQVFFEDFAVYN